jgi:uncharacterized membrane protein
MNRVWINMWKSSGFIVYKTGLSTYQQTTQMQDVLGGQPVVTATSRMLFGLKVVNPQSTGLITVIRFIYRFAHAITDCAHISNNRLAR